MSHKKVLFSMLASLVAGAVLVSPVAVFADNHDKAKTCSGEKACEGDKKKADGHAACSGDKKKADDHAACSGDKKKADGTASCSGEKKTDGDHACGGAKH